MNAKKLGAGSFLTGVYASLVLLALFVVVFAVGFRGVFNALRVNANTLGAIAADAGENALALQQNTSARQLTAHVAFDVDQRLLYQENATKAIAATLTSIYSNRAVWPAHRLPLVTTGEKPGANMPFISVRPGLDFRAIQDEAYRAANCAVMLTNLLVNSTIAGAAVGSESGFVIAADETNSINVDYDPRERSWYRGAVLNPDVYWSDPHVDIRGRGVVITCAVPFYEVTGSRNVLKGVVSTSTPVFALADILAACDGLIGESNDFFMLDNNGRFLFDSSGLGATVDSNGQIQAPNYLSSAHEDLAELARKMVNKESGYMAISYKNDFVHVSYQPIKTLNWSVALVYKDTNVVRAAALLEEEILRVAFDTEERTGMYLKLMFAVLTVALALFLALRFVFAWRAAADTAGRLNGLKERFDAINGGNIAQIEALATREEGLQEFVSSFNGMTSRLREYIHNMETIIAEKERMSAELDLAARVQSHMLSHAFPPFAGRAYIFDIYGEMHPAKEVAGDFYDYFYIDDDHFAFIIADVSGKGFPAALFMIVTKTLIKNMLQSGYSIEQAMEKVNRQTCDSNEAGMFVTTWVGILELSTGKIEFVNAGHNPPLLRTGDNPFVYVISTPDLVIGAVEETQYTRREIYIQPGDILFLYTDGITEAFDTKKNMFGNDRLKKTLRSSPAEDGLAGMFKHIKESLDSWTGGAEQFDDITMLAIRLRPADTAGTGAGGVRDGGVVAE